MLCVKIIYTLLSGKWYVKLDIFIQSVEVVDAFGYLGSSRSRHGFLDSKAIPGIE